MKPEKRCSCEVENFQRLIQMLLFKLIIDNEANLEIEIFYTWNSHLDNILELILQNPNFIHNVKILNLYIRSDSNSGNKYMIAKIHILQLINLHQNLKKISLNGNDFNDYY